MAAPICCNYYSIGLSASPSSSTCAPIAPSFHVLPNDTHKRLPKCKCRLLDLVSRRGPGKCASSSGAHGISIRCSRDSAEEPKSKRFSLRECTFCIALAATIVTMQPSVEAASAFQPVPVLPDLSVLISGPPIKDPKALLRYALPIDNKPIREVQKSLEDITENLKVPGERALEPVARNIRQASRILSQNKQAILAVVAESKKEHGQELMDKLTVGLEDFQKIVEERERDAIAPKQQQLLDFVGG